MTTATKWKLARGKTWRQKLEHEHPNHGKIVPVPPHMQKAFGKGTMLIPRPRDVEAIMRGVKKGKVILRAQIRRKLAAEGRADSACPLSTGLFIRIVAEAAEEDRRSGKKRVTPYWRTLKDDGSLDAKFPGGVQAQAERLRDEGLTVQIATSGRTMKVRDFERHAVKP